MNKGEFIDALYAANQKSFASKSAAAKVVDSMQDIITKTLAKGDEFKIVGLGTLKVAKKAARNGVNPQTGKAIKIAAHNAVKFKAGTTLTEAVAKAKVGK